MDSSISVQFSFFEDHLPRDFLSQFEFSGSDSNLMEDKQIFIRYVFVDFNEMLIYLSNYLKHFVTFPISWSVVTEHFYIYLLAKFKSC